jgi:hypothetical protein
MLQDEDEGTADAVKAKLDGYAEVCSAAASVLSLCITVPGASN